MILDEFSTRLVPNVNLPEGNADFFGRNCDLAIAIGGDGTMLRAAHLLADYNVPLLGINRGRLGFLADIPANAVIRRLDEILRGNYIEDERFQLHCEIESKGKTLMESHAFNDVIIQKGNIAKLIELETFVNGNFSAQAAFRRHDHLIPHRFNRLCACRRRPDIAPGAQRAGAGADLPAYPE